MSLHEFKPLEVCLLDKEKKPDFFLLVSGRLISKNKAKQERIYEPFDYFGYTKPLDENEFIPARIIAKEHSYLISIPRLIMKSAMEKIKKIKENLKIIEFLVKTVPGVRQLGQAGKERTLKLFENCVFKNGDTLLHEAVKTNIAYIIEQGECKQVAYNLHTNRPGTAGSRGLISKTTSSFNYGIVMPGQ